MIQEILALLIVFGLLGATLYVLKHRGAVLWPAVAVTKQPGPEVQVSRRVPLTPQHCLHCVSVGGRQIVLVTHPSGCTVIRNEGRHGV